MAKRGPDEERDSRRRRDRRNDDSSGFSFTLPPLKLPNVAFPKNLQVRLPPPAYDRELDVQPRTLLLVAVLVDLLDAALVIVAGPPLLAWIRPIAGTVVVVVLVGLPGLVYVWEVIAVFAGVGWPTVFPSATALVLARALR